jgi:integrase
MAPRSSSQPKLSKAKKGTVQLKSSNDRLQLVFTWQRKRHYLSLGLPDTPINRKVAEQKARQIELDFVSGNFDPTLDKYRTEGITPIKRSSATVAAHCNGGIDFRPGGNES